MSPNLRLVIVLHNHQPIGNFDGVFEAAYQDSYRAFLDVFEDYTNLPIALHTSGSLMEWLAARHPEYLDRLAALVAAVGAASAPWISSNSSVVESKTKSDGDAPGRGCGGPNSTSV